MWFTIYLNRADEIRGNIFAQESTVVSSWYCDSTSQPFGLSLPKGIVLLNGQRPSLYGRAKSITLSHPVKMILTLQCFLEILGSGGSMVKGFGVQAPTLLTHC